MQKVNIFLNKYYFFLPLIIFTLLHILYFNVNQAEWGDTYRILRASDFIRDQTYPLDEKRPPLFSIVLSTWPNSVDQIMWGRGIMFALSLLSFYVFVKILNHLSDSNLEKHLALMLFAMNPVFFYWSLRIYADLLFTIFVLLAFWVFLVYLKKPEEKRLLLALSLITALSIYTRFEGYILGLSILISLFYLNRFKDLANSLIYGFVSFLLILPFWLYKNPLASNYISEPGGRVYDFHMVMQFLLSLIFIFGFLSASFFFFKKRSVVSIFLKEHILISTFLFLDLVLIVLWPAAIPRLFMPIIPILCFLLARSMYFFYKENPKTTLTDIGFNLLLIVGFSAFQYYYKLQFLIVNKPVFIYLVLLNLLMLFFLYRRNLQIYFSLALVSMFIWLVCIVLQHQNILSSVRMASLYAKDHLEGNLLYNDISSTSDWYLNYADPNDSIEGAYFEYNSTDDIDNAIINDTDYIILTNEHNPALSTDLKGEDFEEIATYMYRIGDVEFSTVIYRNVLN